MPARILVIEDNVANLELLRYLLSHAGHTVLCAVDGLQGLALAQQAQPDLLLCDLQLPGLDGYEVLSRLRQPGSTQHLPVVAVTAFSMPDDRQKVALAGFDGYLTKPIEPAQFVQQVELFLPPSLRSV
jgi:two-component system, cell cycle response regulator DivK